VFYQAHAQAASRNGLEISNGFYSDAEAKGLPMGNLSEIEMTVRSQLLHHVSPELGIFLSKQLSAQTQGKRKKNIETMC
jgi:hypothetical protein